MANICLVKGQHRLMRNENQDIIRGENGGILVMDQISGLLSEIPLLPEVLSFFDIFINDNNEALEETEVNKSSSSSSQNDENCESSKIGPAMWDDKAVKLLFCIYADHQDGFKNTSIKNDTVWNKIKEQMNINGKYHFTRQQIKDKWMNMRKAYVRVKDHNKGTGVTPKTYRYYNEMDNLYGDKPNVKPVAIASNLKAEDENISFAKDSTIDDDLPKQKTKKSKIEHQLSCWSEKFIEHSKERDLRNEKRQEEKTAVIENAIKTFREMMERLIDKL